MRLYRLVVLVALVSLREERLIGRADAAAAFVARNHRNQCHHYRRISSNLWRVQNSETRLFRPRRSLLLSLEDGTTDGTTSPGDNDEEKDEEERDPNGALLLHSIKEVLSVPERSESSENGPDNNIIESSSDSSGSGNESELNATTTLSDDPFQVDLDAIRCQQEARDLQRLREATAAIAAATAVVFPSGVAFDVLEKTAAKTRLLLDRTYVQEKPFQLENLNTPPSVKDLVPPLNRTLWQDRFWITIPCQVVSFFLAYWSFPVLIGTLDQLVTMEPAQLDEVAAKLWPGISILYGTFVSLTLSILYKRQRDIQDNVAEESSLLLLIMRNLLSLFGGGADRNDACDCQQKHQLAIDAGQCIAIQIQTLVQSSRGEELMRLVYADPYARLLELLDEFERQPHCGGSSEYLAASSHDVLKDLIKIRAKRLSDESVALPPTHFWTLNVLTVMLLLSYAISILPTVDLLAVREPSNEACCIFGILTTVFLFFNNFANDLNNPFQGVFQVRTSTTASHLLQLKWFMVNHPLLRGRIDFDDTTTNNNANNTATIDPSSTTMSAATKDLDRPPPNGDLIGTMR